jgi:putative two-component system response regulator
MDFIRKPFVPEVLLLRARNIIELTTLQHQLYYEVEQKTRENKDLFLQIVSSLAAAIYTKDEFTKGHSSRVAEYSKMIAKRAGFSDARQDEIYMIAVMHDIGKIGIPDNVLNKPGKLMEAEYELIKKHSEMGASILKNIENNSKFENGARHHHERYD